MMTSIAVLLLLIGMIGQIISILDQALRTNSGRLDAAEQARQVLDQIGVDLAARPNRSDLPLLFSKVQGNDEISFYSGVPGYSGQRVMAGVSYRIQESNTSRLYQLERGALGTDWTGNPSPVSFLPEPFPTIPDTDYEVLSDAVFRLEFCYIRTDGSYSTTAASDLSNVAGLVVGVAALDAASRKMIGANQLSVLSSALNDSQDGADVVSAWHQKLDTPGAIPGVPPQVQQAIQIYQRQYHVP